MSWREAEITYTDEVIGESPLPVLFEECGTRHAERTAQQYKGGVYDRSLTPDPLPAAPPGEFASLNYDTLLSIVRRLATGFRSLDVGAGDRVAIFAGTRMEWAHADLAILATGGVVSTIYENSSPRMVEYLLQDPGATGVIVDDAAKIETVQEADVDLSFIVCMDDLDTTDMPDTYTLGEVYAKGEAVFDRSTYDSWVDAIEPDDLASIIYTSGTTGRPKGVRLTHQNFRANLNQIRKRYGPRPDKPADLPRIDEQIRTVSFLPLAHVFERTAGHFTMLATGGSIAYAESPETLQEDFQSVRPTVATSVPRVYEKIYAAIRAQAEESAIKYRIFQWAVDVGKVTYRSDNPGLGQRLKQRIADRLVFNKVKSALGGNIEMLISGGGSLSADLCALYHGMGLPIYEGYGLTETAPVATVNPVEEPQIGTIGPPVPDMDIEIDTSVIPRDEFTDETGTVGELLLNGPNVSPGYWKNDEATATAFRDDGTFRTGDIVALQDDGYIRFIDRVKEILVLSTGKNVAPGPIEDAFAPSPVVEQVMVIGDGQKFVSALVVPNFDAIQEWAAQEGVALSDDLSEVCTNERVIERIWEEVEEVNTNLERVETIKKIRLVPDEFTEENNLLTPTMKKKRRNILDVHADTVESIYVE